jgi:predicted outer membrane protein
MHRRDVLVSMLSATAALAVTRTAVAQPTPAGAMPTPVYLAMATKGGLFLENTARDAFAKTGNPRVKRFARAEVNEQVNLANKIDRVTGGNAGVPVGGQPGPGGLVGGLVAAPLAVAGGVAGAAVGTVGGVLGAPGGGGALGGGEAPGGMTSDEQKAQIQAQLSGLQGGPQYDAAFVNASLQGHREAQVIHGSYAQSGEDPALRRIAAGALPLIRLHISQLSQMQRMMGGAEG